MNRPFPTIYLCFVFFLAGCQTIPIRQSNNTNKETSRDVEKALGDVAEALSGKPLTEEERKELRKQILHDKEAQSAIGVISESLDTTKIVVKYCPKTGNRYAAHLEMCPIHNVLLDVVEE